MSSSVVFVRHAQSQNNCHYQRLRRKFGRRYAEFSKSYAEVRTVDPPLSEIGVLQASRLGHQLEPLFRGLGERCLLTTSPMLRAIQTAEKIRSQAELGPMACNLELFELGSTLMYRRESSSQIVERLERAHELRCLDSPRVEYPAREYGETEREFARRLDRILGWLEQHLATSTYDLIVVVTHRGLLARLLRVWVRLTNGPGPLDPSNTGCTTIHWDHKRGPRLVSLNALEHLPPELHT